ncbi:DUF3592 domain-containing protein [Streptantibioticus rubrisoli]|uniref:DUF3592 domain-containing protein n=1 Tax=Streptantibioticus rubrisoli TaxID=1387313 RepID=A0ABT1P501_9ACTN|nr:DUF3592 domain-containing protein [Streptantibioticus rubrisoli]MCQ4040446.1 DUF3592 domain-containing protein [Streptantibioticus rubrisoli]
MVGVFAAITGMCGLVAVLAGVAGLREARRMRRVGLPAGALVKRAPGDVAGEPCPPRPRLQFTTADGRVVEVVSPVPPDRRRPLRDGETVLVFYDPADPRTVVVHRRERVGLEYGFIVAGSVLVVTCGVLLAVAD